MYLFSECHPYGVKEIQMNNETGKSSCDCIDGWDGERCDYCMDFVTGIRCDSCNGTGFRYQDFPNCSECKPCECMEGKDINTQNSDGKTCLELASINGHVNTTQLL